MSTTGLAQQGDTVAAAARHLPCPRDDAKPASRGRVAAKLNFNRFSNPATCYSSPVRPMEVIGWKTQSYWGSALR